MRWKSNDYEECTKKKDFFKGDNKII